MPRKNQRLKQPLAEEKISHSKKSNNAKETRANNTDENPKNIEENESENNEDITSEDKFACSVIYTENCEKKILKKYLNFFVNRFVIKCLNMNPD